MSTMKSGLKPVEVMPQNDPLHLIDVDHVRFVVGNAKQAAMFYASMFGFRITQLHDLTCGARSMARYMLEQGNIRFVLETPLNPDHPANEELRRYGDGIKDIAFSVFDAAAAYDVPGNYLHGANIAGFTKVADAMVDQGVI